MNANTIYSVSILCGGQSRRMGRDKAMLDWNGAPLLFHIARGFDSCDDLFLSVRDGEQYADIDMPRIPDRVKGCGPLAGLCASLQAAKHDILFITTCDAPLVDKTTSDILAGALEEHDCVVPVSSDSKIHPLIAVYRKTVLSKALQNLNSKNLRILTLLDDLDVLYFPAGKLPKGDHTLANLNTPQEAASFNIISH